MFLQHLARVVYAYRELYNRVCQVTVCDGDSVSKPNVGRQAFAENEVGMNKAYAIVSRINRFYNFDWLTSDRFFSYDDKKRKEGITLREYGANFLFSAVDSLAARKMIKKHFYDSASQNTFPEFKGHFWVDMGNTRTTGNVVVAAPELEWPDVVQEYGKFMKGRQKGPSCSLAMALNEQDLFINSYSAVTAAKWLWECLTSTELHWRGAFINLDTLVIRKLKLSTDVDENRTGHQKQQDKPGIEPAVNNKRTRAAKKGKPAGVDRSRRRRRNPV